VAACRNEDGANVAQWGWLANDCQRFVLQATSGGWMRIQSRLPGGRALEAEGCGTAAGTNVVLGDPVAGRCQEFRLQPAGDVLLAAPAGRLVLDAPGCARRRADRVVYRAARGSRCGMWRFRPAEEGYYTIHNARHGGALAPARCRGAGDALVLDRRHRRSRHCLHWRMELRADGSFALVNERAGATELVRILRP
jgi:hypothetical protein